jgi:hypothetical protein
MLSVQWYGPYCDSIKRLAITALAFACVTGCGRPNSSRTPPAEPEVKTRTIKMLPAETNEEIAALVRSAFYDKDRLMEIFCEEMYEPGELEPTGVSAAIDSELAKWEEEKKSWPKVTDCDRLDAAFTIINKRGVIAMHNAGYTQSDGYDDFREAYALHPNKSSILGYCYYHGQDVERAVRGSGLYFAFGPVDPNEEEAMGPQVGKIIREELERTGLKVDWDGTFAKRMSVPNFVWQRR